MRCIIFIFAGRKPYLEIQKRYLSEIISQNPFVELHLWNFSRNSVDHEYLQTLASQLPRATIFNHLYAGDNPITHCTKTIGKLCSCVKCRVGMWSEPYQYYASQPTDDETTYIKLDDDILYIDTHRFTQFISAIQNNPATIISANVLNNGICALTDPKLRNHAITKSWASESDFSLGGLFVLRWIFSDSHTPIFLKIFSTLHASHYA
jgi:hypothetical protein